MSRRSIVLSLALVMFTTSIGIAAGLRSQAQAPRLALQDEAKHSSFPEPLWDMPQIDSQPNLPAPSPAPAPPPPPGQDIETTQQRLTELRYYVTSTDGKAGPSTRNAVMAFQKVNGLKVDGAVGPQTSEALSRPAKPRLRGGPPDRIEVDLTKQVLYFVQNDSLVRVMPVSSGNGAVYRTPSGGRARANTPVGTFRIERRIRGVRVSDLGTLYNPLYFYQGFAIHGSNSVPSHPASHGCIRVTQADGVWLFARAPIGMPVIVYGGTHTFSP
jgi:lipoprotein-anchoring transpeptidase ErfK/SrfK